MLVELTELDPQQTLEFLNKRWGSTRMVAKGRVFDVAALPGFAYLVEGQIAGMITYQLDEGDCQIVTLNSTIRQQGIGAALLKETEHLAGSKGCKRIWCITTNDNIWAIRFYQRNGMTLSGFHRNALELARKLKPQIPLTGQDGIPIEHELEFEKLLK